MAGEQPLPAWRSPPRHEAAAEARARAGGELDLRAPGDLGYLDFAAGTIVPDGLRRLAPAPELATSTLQDLDRWARELRDQLGRSA